MSEEAWDSLVGSQTAEEFMEESIRLGYDTVEKAVESYITELRQMDCDIEIDEDAEYNLVKFIKKHTDY